MTRTLLTSALVGLLAAPPLAAADVPDQPNSTDTVCLSLVGFQHGCATGMLGHREPSDCDERGCRVTLTYNLTVTPIACGRLGNMSTCAASTPSFRHDAETVYLKFGRYEVTAHLCVAAEPTFWVEYCTELSRVVVVSPPSDGAQPLAGKIKQIVSLGASRGPVLLSTSHADIHEGACEPCL